MPFTSETAIAAARKRHGPPKNDGRTYISGSALEARWMAACVELGLVMVDDAGNATNMSRQSWRRLAKRLGDDATALRIRRIHEPRPAALDDDDDLRVAHLTAEASRLRARAIRDYAIAREHDLAADLAAAELADLLWKRGIVS